MKKLLLILGVLVAFTAIGQTPFGSRLYRQQGVLKTDIWFPGPTGTIIVMPGIPVKDSTNVVVNPPVCHECPPPPICPTCPDANIVTVPLGDGNIARYLATAKPGQTLKLTTGTYTEGILNVPARVNIDLNGSTVYCTSVYSGGWIETGVFNFKTKEVGKQWIKNGTIDGRNMTASAINVDGRDSLIFENLTIQNFKFSGIFLRNTKVVLVSKSTIQDAALANNSYSLGQLSLNAVSYLEVNQVNFKASRGRGAGIELIGDPKPSKADHIKIHNCDFSLDPYNPWNGGSSPNFAIEFQNTQHSEVDVYDNTMKNSVSIATNNAYRASNPSGQFRFYRNIVNATGQWFFEVSNDNLSLTENTIGGVSHAFATFNKASTDKPYQNWNISGNTINSANPGYDKSYLRIGTNGTNNSHFDNNKLPNSSIPYFWNSKTGSGSNTAPGITGTGNKY